MVEFFDSGYQFSVSELMPVPPAQLLPWLCEPELMKRWIPGVDDVVVADGSPQAVGCVTTVTLSSGSQYGNVGWRLTGHVDEIGPHRLMRTYRMRSMTAGVLPMTVGPGEYLRTVVYDLTPAAGTQLVCTVRTSIPGLARSAAGAGGRAEAKSLRRSLRVLSQLSAGQRISWIRRAWMTSGRSPQAL